MLEYNCVTNFTKNILVSLLFGILKGLFWVKPGDKGVILE